MTTTHIAQGQGTDWSRALETALEQALPAEQETIKRLGQTVADSVAGRSHGRPTHVGVVARLEILAAIGMKADAIEAELSGAL